MQPQSFEGNDPNADPVLSMPNSEYPYLDDYLPSLSDVNKLRTVKNDTSEIFYKDYKNINTDQFTPRSINLLNPIDYNSQTQTKQENNNIPITSGYKSTGNNVPLKPDELENIFNHVLNLLKQYDITNSGINPYSETLIYTTTDKRVIQIPLTIQNKAIEIHQEETQEMTKPKNISNNETPNYKIPQQYISKHIPQRITHKEQYDQKTLIIGVLLILFVIIYYYRKELNIKFFD